MGRVCSLIPGERTPSTADCSSTADVDATDGKATAPAFLEHRDAPSSDCDLISGTWRFFCCTLVVFSVRSWSPAVVQPTPGRRIRPPE